MKLFKLIYIILFVKLQIYNIYILYKMILNLNI